MDGYEATKQIRELFNKYQIDQPIISAVTGHTEAKWTQKCIDSGMDMVLFKPVNPTDLKKLISMVEIYPVKKEEAAHIEVSNESSDSISGSICSD